VLGALVREPQRRRAPDPAPAARDEDVLSPMSPLGQIRPLGTRKTIFLRGRS
jgi:hypothetical protein